MLTVCATLGQYLAVKILLSIDQEWHKPLTCQKCVENERYFTSKIRASFTLASPQIAYRRVKKSFTKAGLSILLSWIKWCKFVFNTALFFDLKVISKCCQRKFHETFSYKAAQDKEIHKIRRIFSFRRAQQKLSIMRLKIDSTKFNFKKSVYLFETFSDCLVDQMFCTSTDKQSNNLQHLAIN